MHARKPRYDESFVDTQPAAKNPARDSEVKIVGAGTAEYVPSPARALQQQIEGRLQHNPATDTAERYSSRTNILIITGFSALTWAGILGIGWLVAG